MDTLGPFNDIRLRFYFLFVLLLVIGVYATYYFGLPKTEERTGLEGIVDAPTVITASPIEEVTVLAPEGVYATGTKNDLLNSTSTMLAPVATATPQGGAGTPQTTKKKVSPPAPKNVAVPQREPEKDLLPPKAPTNLVIKLLTDRWTIIGWESGGDNVGVVGYKVFREGKEVEDTTKTLHTSSDLVPGTKYVFGVVAYDASGNVSPMNNILVETTGVAHTVSSNIGSSTAQVASTTASLPVSLCGNGTQDRGEECDDGNSVDGDMCTNKCTATRCGDGVTNPMYEECDDGNEIDGDYCTNQCRNHTPTLLQQSVYGLGGGATTPSPAPTPSPGATPGASPTPTPTPTPTPSPTPAANPVTYTLNVTSAGNYSPTTLTLKVGDSIRFTYSGTIQGEVITDFTPSTISSVTLDAEFTTRTRVFSTPGTWSFKAKDHNGNTGTLIVQ